MSQKALLAISVLALTVSQVAYAKEEPKKKNDKELQTLDEVSVSAEGVREELLPESDVPPKFRVPA